MTNKEIREKATQLAAIVARSFDKRRSIKCNRVTRKRGWAWRSNFSIPRWAGERHPLFLSAYTAHEAVHCLTGYHDGTGLFREAEKKALALFGLRPDYTPNCNYVVLYRNLITGEPLFDQWGRPVLDEPANQLSPGRSQTKSV